MPSAAALASAEVRPLETELDESAVAEVAPPPLSERIEQQAVTEPAIAQPAEAELPGLLQAVEQPSDEVPSLETSVTDVTDLPETRAPQFTAPLPAPAPVQLPEGMVMVETNPGRSQIAPAVATEPVPERRRTPRSQPAETPSDEAGLVQVETRK
jgi:hypothetical protein